MSEYRQVVAGFLILASPIWIGLVVIVGAHIWPNPSIIQIVGVGLFAVGAWLGLVLVVGGPRRGQ